MEGVYEAVVDRLAMLGYTVTDDDETGLKYTIRKCEAELLANINHRKLPPPLFTPLWTWWPVISCLIRKPPEGLTGWRALTSTPPPRVSRRGTSP